MDKLTLRDAAERTGLSITTLRRYIRSGRLTAEKSPGRYGPEYSITRVDLDRAGIATPGAAAPNGSASGEGALPAPTNGRFLPTAPAPSGYIPEVVMREMIPIDLYRELAMKHEQILVQYGMVRVGGQRMMEFKIESERLAEELRSLRDQAQGERERHEKELGFLRKHLREAELEIEEKNQDLAALRERIRMLELVSRNATTTETIEQQFLQVFEKRREMDELSIEPAGPSTRTRDAFDELLRTTPRARVEEPTDQ